MESFEKKHINIVGTGKVAYHLGKYLLKSGHHISGVWGRNRERATYLAKEFSSVQLDSLETIAANTISIICVSDRAISEVIEQIPSDRKVAYTSGGVQLQDLPSIPNLGVFYPLQTFSEKSKVDISKVPFLIEATNSDFETELFELASTLSSNVQMADSNTRFTTHVAAVLVNNFSNFLFYLAQEHLKEHRLDFSILMPLIQETIKKLEFYSPLEAQTGPAARGDYSVIQKHLSSISRPDTKELYRLFSEYIDKEINSNEL